MNRADLRVPWFLLSLLLGWEMLSLVGFATLGLHTEWHAEFPQVAAWRERVFSYVAQLQLYSSMAVLAVFLCGLWDWKWLGAFAGVFGLTLIAEHCGTSFGIPFGQYGYSELLGFKIGGRVPAVIPMSWFSMGFASYSLAAILLPRRGFPRLILAAGFLTCWDLVIDPAMSHVTGFWWWAEEGVYYATPLVNFLGWMLTGLAISVVLDRLLPGALEASQAEWIRSFYLVNFFLPLGMMLAAGLWMGSLLAIATLGAVYPLTCSMARADALKRMLSYVPLRLRETASEC